MDKASLRDFYVDVVSFSMLINAGCTMVRCLELLKLNGRHPDTLRFFPEVQEKIAGGETLTRALAGSGGEWASPIVVVLVRAGEVGGVLDETLYRLADFYLQKVQNKPRSERAQVLWLFGTLLESGVPVLHICREISAVFENEDVKKAFLETVDNLKEGLRLSDCEGISSYFGPMVMQMLTIGEECGCLDLMCYKSSDLLEIMDE